MNFCIANIDWLPNKWNGLPTETEKNEMAKKSGFRYVKEKNIPYECFNFSNLTEFEGFKFGFIQFRNPPKVKNFDVIFFHSAKKLVGFYKSAEIIDPKIKEIQGLEFEFNVKCSKEDWLLFDKFIEFKKERHLIKERKVKNRISQGGFNYIDPEAARNIFEDAKSISRDNVIRTKIETFEKAIFSPNSEQKFWKISPGERGKCWENCLNKGIIGIGKVHNKDLHDLNEEEVKEYVYKERGAKSASIIRLIFHIEKGHIIVAYSGPSTIYGVGIVEENDWKYNSNVSEELQGCLRNTRKVNWVKSFSPLKIKDKEIISILGKQEPIFEISKEFFIQKLLPLFPEELNIESFSRSNEIIESPILDLLSNKFQIIFYGPPGTGKTLKAKKCAVKFLEMGE